MIRDEEPEMPSDTGIEPPQPMNIRDRRALWRVFFWGGSTAFALAAAAFIATTDFGAQHLRQTLASVLEPANAAVIQSPERAAQAEREIRQLAETVKKLTGDRDRLSARVAMLEQSLDDITGSVKRQAEQLAAAQEGSQARAQATAKEAATPPPVISAPTTTLATVTPADPTVKSAPAPTITGAVPAIAEPPGPVTAAVPLPPSRAGVSAEPASEEIPPMVKNEIGIDVGGASTMEALRAHWAAVKANHGPLLGGLRPLIVTRAKKPAGAEYRLILGPLPTAAAATRLCAQFASAHSFCRAGVFSGQILAMR